MVSSSWCVIAGPMIAEGNDLSAITRSTLMALAATVVSSGLVNLGRLVKEARGLFQCYHKLPESRSSDKICDYSIFRSEAFRIVSPHPTRVTCNDSVFVSSCLGLCPPSFFPCFPKIKKSIYGIIIYVRNVGH